MTKEQQFILLIIKNHLHNEKTVPQTDIDWNNLYDISISHQITGIVNYQCKEFIPSDFSMKFSSAMMSTISSNVNRRLQNAKLEKHFRDANIDYFVVKGSKVAKYYPVDTLRSMGDTDYVVSDREKANEILLNDGFANILDHPSYEWAYVKNGMEYELHTDLFYDETINNSKITDFLSNYNEYLVSNELEINYHFIYVLLHLRKHFMDHGVGFRQFIDLAVFIKNEPNLDWNWIEKELTDLDTIGFAKKVFSYIDCWFGISAPIDYEKISDDEFEGSTEYIFKNGVFGYDNIENDDYKASNNVRNSKHPRFAMFINAVKAIFLPYKALITSEKYRFLIGKPYLLPVAWIYRIFKSFSKEGLNNGKKAVANSFVDVEYIEKRNELFAKWQLN